MCDFPGVPCAFGFRAHRLAGANPWSHCCAHQKVYQYVLLCVLTEHCVCRATHTKQVSPWSRKFRSPCNWIFVQSRKKSCFQKYHCHFHVLKCTKWCLWRFLCVCECKCKEQVCFIVLRKCAKKRSCAPFTAGCLSEGTCLDWRKAA